MPMETSLTTDGEVRTTDPPPVLRTLVDSLIALDFDGLAACLTPDVRLRELIPGGPGESRGRSAAVGRFEVWFGESTDLELRDIRIEPAVDRWLVAYRIDLVEDAPRRVEQHLFCDFDTALITRIDLLCSGFRLLAPRERGSVHHFDAGTLGCGDGLAGEFRSCINRIPVGDSLVVVARDPAAREDLPALARLLGNRVISVDTDDQGLLEMTVERTR